MRYHEILEAIKNDDDDIFAPRFKFGNLSRPDALEKYNDLYDELYGYESYWHGDEPEFEEKEKELERLKIYVRQKFGEAFYNHMIGAEQTRDNRSDVFSKKDPFSNRQHREDPRITKAGKLHKQDVLGLRNDVKNRIGTHRTPVLPESEDDNMFAGPGDFSKNLKSSIQQETDPYRRLVVKVREISKQLLGVSARVSMSPAAVGRPVQKLGRATFLFGKFPQGSPESIELVRRMQEALTDLGLDTKVTNSGWLSVKVPAPFASLDENNDDELFGSAPSAATLTQSIARAIVRSDKSARLITSPFMVGFALGKTPGGEHLLQYWKSMGQEKQDAMLDGINDAVYDLIANKVTEDDDDDMFGSSTRPDSKVIAQDLELWLRRRQTGSRRPLAQFEVEFVEAVIAGFNRSFLHGIHVWSKYKLSNTDIRYDLRNYIEDVMGVDVADHDDTVNENAESDDDELFGAGGEKVFVVSAPDDEILDTFSDIRQAIAYAKKQIPSYLEDGWGDDDFITVYKQRQNNNDDWGVPVAHFPITDDPIDENDDSDDDLFGVSGPAAQRMIYKFGKQMLAKLEQAYNDPHVKAQYEKLTQGEEPDANRLFDLVCRSTGTPFGKAIVVDSILREYAGGFSGLNDFGTLIDSGEWQHDMVEMWDMFGEDPDVAQQDWFRKELQTFMGDR